MYSVVAYSGVPNFWVAYVEMACSGWPTLGWPTMRWCAPPQRRPCHILLLVSYSEMVCSGVPTDNSWVTYSEMAYSGVTYYGVAYFWVANSGEACPG